MKAPLLLLAFLSSPSFAAAVPNTLVADLFNCEELSQKLTHLRDDTYLVSSVTEEQVLEDDGSRMFVLQMTPTADSFGACKIKVRVKPYLSIPERAHIESTNCPKPL